MSSKSVRNCKDMKNQHAQVFLRCRPMSQSEQKCHSIIDIVGQKEICVHDRSNNKLTKTYSFDKVFGPLSHQREVYQAVVEPLIADVLSGFNCTVLAYGQTGSGKTFTMEGDLDSDLSIMLHPDSKAGLIPRTMSALFDELRVQQLEFTLRLSFVELYNEELYDLLSPDDVPSKLRLFDDSTKKGAVIIQGMQEVMVHTFTQVLEELKKGSAKRQVAATHMNANSSRSHTVFCVTVHTKENSVDGEELLKTAKLYLVDLAGSENIARSGSVDKRAREAGNINQSLLTLGRVISSLVEHQPHVPYRESKLTRILQDSLGGRTKTSIIATVSLAHTNLEETLSTLDYAHKAKSISNRPEVNQKVSKQAVLKQYRDVINDLKQKLELHRKSKGFYLANENYQKLRSDIVERQNILSTKVAELKGYVVEAMRMDENFKNLSMTIEERAKELECENQQLEATVQKVDVASKELAKTTEECEEANELLKVVTKHDYVLRNQATELTTIAFQSFEDSEKIHDKLDHVKDVVEINKKKLLEFQQHLHQIRTSYLRTGKEFQVILSKMKEIPSKLNSDLKLSSSEVSALTSILSTMGEGICNTFKQFAVCCNEAAEYYHMWEGEKQMEIEESVRSVTEMLSNANTEMQRLCAHFKECINSIHLTGESMVTFLRDEHAKMKQVVDTAILNMTSANNETAYYMGTKVKDVQEHFDNVMTLHQCLVEKNKSSTQELMELQAQISKCISKWEETAENKFSMELDLKQKLIDQQDILRKNITLVPSEIESRLKMCDEHLNASVRDHSSVCERIRTAVPQRLAQISDTIDEAEKKLSEVTNYASDFNKNQELALVDLKSQTEHSCLLRMEASEDFVKEMERNLNESMTKAQTLRESTESRGKLLSQNILSGGDQLCQTAKDFSSEMSEAAAEIKGHTSGAIDMVQQFINGEIVPDKPTGQTPQRRQYNPLPKLDTLASPFARKIMKRVVRFERIVHRITKSERRVRKMVLNSINESDDYMASDTEVTCRKKNLPSGLIRTQSLSDLSVFSEPQAPGRKKAFRVIK